MFEEKKVVQIFRTECVIVYGEVKKVTDTHVSIKWADEPGEISYPKDKIIIDGEYVNIEEDKK